MKTTNYAVAFIFSLSSSSLLADKLMTKEQYTDYSVQYRCIELSFHDDLNKKEDALIKLEESFGLNDDNFDAFDELITEYERDSNLLETVAVRTKSECSQA